MAGDSHAAMACSSMDGSTATELSLQSLSKLTKCPDHFVLGICFH